MFLNGCKKAEWLHVMGRHAPCLVLNFILHWISCWKVEHGDTRLKLLWGASCYLLVLGENLVLENCAPVHFGGSFLFWPNDCWRIGSSANHHLDKNDVPPPQSAQVRTFQETSFGPSGCAFIGTGTTEICEPHDCHQFSPQKQRSVMNGTRPGSLISAVGTRIMDIGDNHWSNTNPYI